MGLWKLCKKEVNTCVTIPNNNNPNFPKTELYFCRTLSILGLLLLVGCLLTMKQGKKVQLGMACAAAFVILLSVLIWRQKFSKISQFPKLDFGYSSMISMVVGILTLASAAYFNIK